MRALEGAGTDKAAWSPYAASDLGMAILSEARGEGTKRGSVNERL